VQFVVDVDVVFTVEQGRDQAGLEAEGLKLARKNIVPQRYTYEDNTVSTARIEKQTITQTKVFI
jgi:hypothetical protein